MRALSRHPHERFGSMEELARALAAGLHPRRITPVSLPRVTQGRAGRPDRQRRAGSRRYWCALALAGAAWLLTRDHTAPGASLAAEAESRVLAVLPFKNLGNPADQYFADGLTEELTSRLASLGGLRVISRTSTEQYRESPKSLREIGAELGAGYVLEGSVRWERGDSGTGRIRVTPRLIAVAQDSPLWSEEYEVELTEVFRVQSAIAERVTSALDLALRCARARLARGRGNGHSRSVRLLSPGQRVRRPQLQPQQCRGGGGPLPSGRWRSTPASRPRGPGSAERTPRCTGSAHDRSPSRVDSARTAVDRALRLAPDLAEARVARGYLYYWGMSDYDRALEEFEAARRQQPGNSELLTAIGYVERRQGEWDSALAHLEEAVRYDPRSALRVHDLADTHMMLRHYAEAERAFDRAIQLSPDWAEPWAYKAMLQLEWHGDLARAHAVMVQALRRVSAGRLAQALTIPDAISGALLTSDTTLAETLEAIRPASFDGDSARYHLLHAEAAGFRGDRRAERAHADSALSLLERQVRQRPDDAKLLARIGLAYARAGRRADAIRSGLRAAGLLPPSRDANSGPFVLTRLAQIYTADR